MSDAESKRCPVAAEREPERDGFVTPGRTVPARKQKKAKRIPSLQNDPAGRLFDDALEAARRLKREHRAYYIANRKAFRATISKAHSRVFRLKPGPKQDTRIAAGARSRAHGATWEQLYAQHIDHYAGMPEFTRDLAEAGFKRKVNAYLHKHPRLRRKSSRRIKANR